MITKYKGEHKLSRQNGGTGSFAYVVVELSSRKRGSGNLFESHVNESIIPKKFIASIENGINSALSHGTLIGAPIVDVKIDLIGGGFHEVDSNPESFKEAGKKAFIDAYSKAPKSVLEPIIDLEVEAANEYISPLLSDLNRRRGKIQEVDFNKIKAKVPLSETIGYATDLRSLTKGSGSSCGSPCGYEEIDEEILNGTMLPRGVIK